MLHVLSETPLNVFMRFVGSSEGVLSAGGAMGGVVRPLVFGANVKG